MAKGCHSRLQPGSGSLPFGCAQQKGAHTLTYIFRLNVTYYFAASVCLWAWAEWWREGRFLARRTWGGKKEHTYPFSFVKVAALPLANPSNTEVSAWPERCCHSTMFPFWEASWVSPDVPSWLSLPPLLLEQPDILIQDSRQHLLHPNKIVYNLRPTGCQ